MTNTIRKKIGKEELILESGRMAKQADGAVTVQYGGTIVLVTAVYSKEIKEGADFFPLTVEYQEKTYAAGKIPGGFFKREGRPSEKEILTARLIDRPIRPLFLKGFLNEVQIMGMVLSSDGENDSDILAMIGGSASIHISEIPFIGPIGAVRVGRAGEDFIVNPTHTEIENSDLNLVVAGSKDGIIMLEGGANEIDEAVVLKAIDFARPYIEEIIQMQEELRGICGKEKIIPEIKGIDEGLVKKVEELSIAKLKEINTLGTKEQREEAMEILRKEVAQRLKSENPEVLDEDIKRAFVDVERQEVRRMLLETGSRVDGRRYNEIRPITCEVGVLPRTHGSGLFTRGQTQSLSTTTLGTSQDEQLIDALEGETFKSFMLHYNFPPFSVGEVAPVRGPGRREIGHGALAERALRPIMPSKEEFPYTIRVVSDILESNGSSSMATVCAGTLSLMDAGVPIKRPVTGIAMGLIKEQKKTIILTDISGLEDHFGDMDFKVTGTENGITAIQMDLKIDGIGTELIFRILEESKPARLFVLEKILQTIREPKSEISEYAPRIVTINVNPEKIRDLIGPGGKTIKKIIEETGVTIDIEDGGKVLVASNNEEASAKAIEIIRSITAEAEVGKVYAGKIKRITNFGAFCEILPGKEGLIHISEISDRFVKNIEDFIKVGDEVKVKVIEIDEMGRVNLSLKQAQD